MHPMQMNLCETELMKLSEPEGLFYNLAVCLNRYVQPNEPSSWGRLLDRSLNKFYRLYGADSSKTQSEKLLKQLQSILFDARLLNRIARPKMRADSIVSFFSFEGDFARVSFLASELASCYYVSLDTARYLPIGWIDVLRRASIIGVDQGPPISHSFADDLRSIRRVRSWSSFFSWKIRDRRWRLGAYYRPSRYSYSVRHTARNRLHAEIAIMTRRVYQKRGLLKQPDFLPRPLREALYLEPSAPASGRSQPDSGTDPLAVSLTVRQRSSTRLTEALHHKKLDQFVESSGLLIPNVRHNERDSRYFLYSFSNIVKHMFEMIYELVIEADERRMFPFHAWERQLAFIARFASRLRNRIIRSR